MWKSGSVFVDVAIAVQLLVESVLTVDREILSGILRGAVEQIRIVQACGSVDHIEQILLFGYVKQSFAGVSQSCHFRELIDPVGASVPVAAVIERKRQDGVLIREDVGEY